VVYLLSCVFNEFFFLGKRWNALRNRTDSTNYDVDQLLVGTILLTLVAFTLPTVFVYYSLFALVRIFFA